MFVYDILHDTTSTYEGCSKIKRMKFTDVAVLDQFLYTIIYLFLNRQGVNLLVPGNCPQLTAPSTDQSLLKSVARDLIVLHQKTAVTKRG